MMAAMMNCLLMNNESKAVGNFGGSLASITSKEKKNIKSIAKSGTSPEASQKNDIFTDMSRASVTPFQLLFQ